MKNLIILSFLLFPAVSFSDTGENRDVAAVTKKLDEVNEKVTSDFFFPPGFLEIVVERGRELEKLSPEERRMYEQEMKEFERKVSER